MSANILWVISYKMPDGHMRECEPALQCEVARRVRRMMRKRSVMGTPVEIIIMPEKQEEKNDTLKS